MWTGAGSRMLKKLGIVRKKYDSNAQPWLMRLNGKGGRKYREGGVAENTTFYVFAHGKDGAFSRWDEQWCKIFCFNKIFLWFACHSGRRTRSTM